MDTERVYTNDTIRYDTVWNTDSVLKSWRIVTLIYRTEPKQKKCKEKEKETTMDETVRVTVHGISPEGGWGVYGGEDLWNM